MDKIKKIIVFSTGDSKKIATWSNVPYLFTETLIAQGFDVKRVHVKEIAIFTLAYRVVKKVLAQVFHYSTTFDYSRSALHFLYSKLYMEMVLKNNDYDAVLILNCSYFPVVSSKKPIILFCDWTYEYYLKYFLNRSPDRFELRSVNRENAVIEKADYVFVLFPVVCIYMLQRYKNANVHYLGNVINAIEQPSFECVKLKTKSNSILFIGKEHYLEGANQLIQVFSVLRKYNPSLKLDIIGMNESFFSDLPEGVKCHGYLDKGTEKERILYYTLLQNAKIFINTTSKWASFSATLEAMYFYTPVITTSYPEFIETFGEEINFGYYYNDKLDNLPNLINGVFSADEYENLCINSHTAVKDFTWTNYVNKFIHIITNGSDATKTISSE